MGRTKFIFRFLLLNFIFLALPLLIATTVSLIQYYEKTVEQAREEIRQVASLRTNTFSEWLPAQMPAAKELIYFLELGTGKLEPAVIGKKLEEVVSRPSGAGYYFALLGPEPVAGDFHEILASSDPKYAETKKNLFYVNPIYLESGHGVIMRYLQNLGTEYRGSRPYLIGLQGFYNESGELEGFLVQAVDMGFVLMEVTSTTLFPYLQFAILNDRSIVMGSSDHKLEGHFFHPIDREVWLQSSDLGTIQVAEKPLESTAQNKDGFFEFEWDGQTQLACEVPVPQMELSIMVFTPKAAFFTRALNQYAVLYIVYVAILLIGFVMVIAVGIWISRPFQQLSTLMEEVSRGNLEVKFQPQVLGYEMNLLGEIFNSTLSSLQHQIAQAEDERVKREVYQRELTLGLEVQKSLFPDRFPEEKGIDLAGCYIPSEKVSGDFYLVEKHKAGLLVAMFDVAGKGIHSSLYALSVRSLLRSYATMIDDVGELMTRVNADFAAESDVSATAFVSLIDPNHGKLYYTSCGHLPAILKRAAGDVSELESGSWALGENPDAKFETRSVDLQKGDSLFIFVDGLTEALNPQGEPIQVGGVKRVIESGQFATAEAGVEALNQFWEEHTGEKTPSDEILILTCRIES